MNDWSFNDSLISINLRIFFDSFFKNQGKGGGEVINLEKQFVKGLQNLGEPLIFKLVGKLQNLQYMKLIEWPIFSNFLLSDLTSQGNPVTRGLSVRYDTILSIKSPSPTSSPSPMS